MSVPEEFQNIFNTLLPIIDVDSALKNKGVFLVCGKNKNKRRSYRDLDMFVKQK